MTLARTGDVVAAAAQHRSGVGAFNVIHVEHAQAIVAGAEAADAPVVLQISENCVRYHGGLEAIGAAMLAVARAAAVPVAVHLDHAEHTGLVDEAVAMGFTSVMFDASSLPFAENVATTAEVVQRCHSDGVWVEAELGEVGGKDGVHAPGARTDPVEASDFVAATGVDALAVAVGSSHAMLTRDAVLDLDLIAALAAQVPVPLVLHGSSGVSDPQLSAAVASGMSKINISTQLNKVFTAAVRNHLAAHPELVDSRRYIAAGRQAVTDEVARLIRILRSRTPAQPDQP